MKILSVIYFQSLLLFSFTTYLFLYNFHFKQPLSFPAQQTMLPYLDKQLKTINLTLSDQSPLESPSRPSLVQSRIRTLLQNFRKDRGQSFISSYMQLDNDQSLAKRDNFAILIELLNFCEGQRRAEEVKILKQMLSRLLDIEGNNSVYLNLIAKEVFLEIKNFNPITYERKEKKAKDKVHHYLEIKQKWAEDTKAFSQIILSLNIFFSQANYETDRIRKRLIQISGRNNISFDRIADTVLELMPVTPFQFKMVEIARMFNPEKLKILLVNRIDSKKKSSIQLKYLGNISQLLEKKEEDLFFQKLIDYNPSYIKILKVLISANIFRLQNFQGLLPCSTPLFYLRLQEEHIDLIQNGINQIIRKETYANQMEEENSQQNLKLYGQIPFCFKLALMHQYLRQNQWSEFRQIYSFLGNGGRINLLVFCPLLKQMCLLVDWYIDRFYKKHWLPNVLVPLQKQKKMSSNSFEGGELKQLDEINRVSIDVLMELLEMIGINIGYCLGTFIKICRTFRLLLRKRSVDLEMLDEEDNRIRLSISGIIKNYFLGAISLADRNYSAVFQLQSLLMDFKQVQRFEFFSYFVNNVLFQNAYLMNQFKNDRESEQIFNRASVDTFSKDAKLLNKMQYNQVFRSCHNLLLKITEEKLNKNLSFFIKIISQASLLHKDVMLYFCLQFLTKEEATLMSYYDIPRTNYTILIRFIYELFKANSDLQLASLFQISLIKLNEHVIQASAAESKVVSYNKNLFFMKIFSFLLEEMCPSLSDVIARDSAEKCEFLLYGYCLKLQVSSSMDNFLNNKQARRCFYRRLCQRSANKHSFLYQFIKSLSYHMKNLSFYSRQHQEDASITMEKHAKSIDECSQLISHLIKLVCLEYTLEREENRKSRDQAISSKNLAINKTILLEKQLPNTPIPLQQLSSLIIEEKVEIGLVAILYRQFFKKDIESNDCRQLIKIWAPIMHKVIEMTPVQMPMQRMYVFESRSSALIESDLFFYFWMTQSSQLISQQQKYCNKITELRKQLNREQIQKGKINGQSSQAKKNKLLAISQLCQEKQNLLRAFEEFNYINSSNYVSGSRIRQNKFKVPPEFDSVREKGRGSNLQWQFKDFISIFFSNCLLPRMLIDPCEAIFCSRFLIKIIQENKIPSNKALIMIFQSIVAAVDYVQFSTDRQATKCLPIFVSDLLRLFKNWNNSADLHESLLNEIKMEKFTENRYQILRKYIYDFLCSVNEKLISPKREGFVLKNIISFIERTALIPLALEQGEELLNYFKRVEESYRDGNCDNLLKRVQKLQELLKLRMKVVPTIAKKAQIKNKLESIERAVVKAGHRSIDLDNQISRSPVRGAKVQRRTQKKKMKIEINLCD